MVRMERSKACFAKAVSLSNVTDLRRAGLIRPNTASMTEMVSAAVFPASRVARVTRDFRSCRSFMQDEYGPRALADDEVAVPVTLPSDQCRRGLRRPLADRGWRRGL